MTQPTLLVEVCFASNREDAIAYHQHFERLCQAIAQCVANYLGYRRQQATVLMSQKMLGTIKTLVHHLNYYDAPRWQQPKGVLAKGTVLTVVARKKSRERVPISNGERYICHRIHSLCGI